MAILLDCKLLEGEEKVLFTYEFLIPNIDQIPISKLIIHKELLHTNKEKTSKIKKPKKIKISISPKRYVKMANKHVKI